MSDPTFEGKYGNLNLQDEVWLCQSPYLYGTSTRDDVRGGSGEQDLLAVVVGAPIHVPHGVGVQQG